MLGRGSFSTVYKGLDISTNTPVAIKTMKTEGLKEDDRRVEMFKKEVKNL